MSGWIHLHRKILEWEWYDDTNVFRVFMHCLLSANWKDKTWRGIEIKKGSFFSSYERIGENIGLSRQQTRTALDKLKSTSEVTTKSTRSGLLVTVCKYADYNSVEPFQQHATKHGSNQSNSRDVTPNQHSDNHLVTTTEEGEEGKKEKKERTSSASTDESAKAGPAPSWSRDSGWEGIEDSDMAKWSEAFPACDIRRQLAAMSLWLEANPAKAKKSNWRRFISTWLTKSQDRGGDIAGGYLPGIESAKAKGPDWLPEHWRTIAARIAGPSALTATSHTELSPTDQMKLYQICKGELNLDEEDAA